MREPSELVFLEIALLAKLQKCNQKWPEITSLLLVFLVSQLKDLAGACPESMEFSTVYNT